MKTMFMLLFLVSFMALPSCSKQDNGTEEVPKIEISDSELEFNYTSATKDITVSSSMDWRVSSSETWVSFSQNRGNKGDTEITITLADNNEMEARTSDVIFKSGDYLQKYVLTQNPDPVFKELNVTVPEGYKLVWHEEFNQERLSNGNTPLPDMDKWWFETGNGGWGNNEIQDYIPGFKGADTCAVISDGTLKIIAKKVGSDVLSIRMNTSEGWTYGYFEARLKLPVGKGTWPAFWMMPKNYKAWPDDGEIDIMEEVGYHPNYVSSSVHTKSYNHVIGTQKTAEVLVPTAQTDFHVYALEWTDNYIYGFIDGECHFRFTNDKKGNKDTWPFNAPFYLKLNLAWGGNWGGAQGVDESFLPAFYEVDYVRVFKKQD